MMSLTSTPPPAPGKAAPRAGTAELGRGVLIGFTPLGLLVVIVAAAVALTVGVQALTVEQGFSTEQIATVLTLGLGLALGFVVYTIAIVRIWRRMTAWRLAGYASQASGALWALAITALLVLLPVIVALLIPQHPAP